MFFIFQIPYGLCLDGTQFAYMGEFFPSHLRAEGVSLGVAMISFTNNIRLQAAPTAFLTTTWKFYLAFIVPGTIGGLIIFFYFPNTNSLPLEECAAIFGDQGEVAVYQAEINVQNGVVTNVHSQ
jgi:hypothetical protein